MLVIAHGLQEFKLVLDQDLCGKHTALVPTDWRSVPELRDGGSWRVTNRIVFCPQSLPIAMNSCLLVATCLHAFSRVHSHFHSPRPLKIPSAQRRWLLQGCFTI